MDVCICLLKLLAPLPTLPPFHSRRSGLNYDLGLHTDPEIVQALIGTTHETAFTSPRNAKERFAEEFLKESPRAAGIGQTIDLLDSALEELVRVVVDIAGAKNGGDVQPQLLIRCLEESVSGKEISSREFAEAVLDAIKKARSASCTDTAAAVK